MLEIGTGCGYQTAVLAELAASVLSMERLSSLAAGARQLLDSLGYSNIAIRVGDGTLGWAEAAPFDAIVVTAGTPQVPRPLVAQLKEGGRLVFPIGEEELQTLVRIRKEGERLHEEYFGDCLRFVRIGRTLRLGGGDGLPGPAGRAGAGRGGVAVELVAKDARQRTRVVAMVVAAGCTAAHTPSSSVRGGGIYHEVTAGENLWRIGKAYGVSHAELARVNGIQDPNRLEVGQRIFVPGGKRSLPVSLITPEARGGRRARGSGRREQR